MGRARRKAWPSINNQILSGYASQNLLPITFKEPQAKVQTMMNMNMSRYTKHFLYLFDIICIFGEERDAMKRGLCVQAKLSRRLYVLYIYIYIYVHKCTVVKT